MDVTEIKSDELSREFKVVVPAAEIEQKFEQRLTKLAETVRLPGFRPGKVPFALLRKRYGESLRGEILEETINESSQSVISDRGLRPAMAPRVELSGGGLDNADLEYTLTVELLPEIEQPDFSAITLERLVAEPDEAHVSGTVERLANMLRGSQAVEEVRPATENDVIVVDVVSPVAPEPFGDGKDLPIALSESGPVDGFVEQLMGVQVGETRSVTLTFPEDFGVATVAGTTVTYEMAVKELRQRDPVSIDDDLAKKLGVESMEQLLKDIREHHDQELKAASRMRLKRMLLDQLDKLYTFTLPKGLVEREFETISRRLQEEDKAGEDVATPEAAGEAAAEPLPSAVAESDADVPAEAAEGDVGHSEEKRREYYELAERRVRLGLVLAEIGRRNNLRVTPEEIGKAMVAEARRFPGQEKAVIDFFRSNAEAREQLAAPLLEEKVIDFILEMVSINERTVTAEDLLRADADDTTFEGEADSPGGVNQSPSAELGAAPVSG